MLWHFEYFIPPIWVIIHVARFPVAQVSDGEHNDCHSWLNPRHSTNRPTSVDGKSSTTSGRDQNPLRPCLLVLSGHVIILFFGYTIACIWIASISCLRMCFGRLRTKHPAQPEEPVKQGAWERFLYFTLWIWVAYDVLRIFTDILVTRQSISRSERTGSLEEWGIGQVAAMVAWLPMVIQLVELFWPGARRKHRVFPSTFVFSADHMIGQCKAEYTSTIPDTHNENEEHETGQIYGLLPLH